MSLEMRGIIAAAVLALSGATGVSAAVVDTIEAPTGFFTPSAAQQLSPPYYRGNGEDWMWQHNPIAGGFTSASLSIGAFDVDAPDEVDEIYAKDNGTWTLLGTLEGNNNVFAFTTFNLGANFFDDIEAGLEVMIAIDVLDDGWLVSLSKSVLTTDGANPGNPNPGVVPLPAAGWLLLSGLGGLYAMRRRARA